MLQKVVFTHGILTTEMKQLITVFCIIFFLLSCTKFGKTDTAKGHVLNPITGEPIAGVPLKLLKTTNGLPGGNKAVKTTTTDANGYFELSKAGFKSYNIQCDLPADYYPIGWAQNGELKSPNTGFGLKKGKTLKADFWAVPYGEIKTSIHNVTCQGVNDTLIFKRIYSSFSDIQVFQPFILTGCYNNEGLFAKVPSGNYKIEWTVIKSGTTTNNSYVLFVPANGQATYNIDY